jgi:flagellar hook-associated protein 2
MSMSVDGLISGMDTTALISQLLQAEAGPQLALKSKLSATQTAASAYRTVNTTFAAVRAAAEALSTSTLAASRKATSNSTSVTASASTSAVDGSSLTFSVTGVASTQTLMSNSTWSSPTAAVRSAAEPAWPIEIRDVTGTTVIKSIDVPAGATLNDAAAAINKANAGVTAAVVRTGNNQYRLAFTSTKSGAAGSVMVVSATDTATTLGSQFLETSPGRDATIDLGGGLTATSSSNTFNDLVAGVSVTVSKADPGTPVTITVGQDADGVATKVQALVDAVNAALATVKTYTDNSKGSTAALKGDYAVSSLAGQLLEAVSSAVGSDGSPARVGFQLSKDGKVTFDKAKFTSALKDTPDLAQRMVVGQAASLGADGVVGGGDDLPAVTGIAGRLLAVAKSASDSATGSLVGLAKGQDSLADDIKDRIEAWDLRLAKRKEMLTRQFSAMETALSSLKNQSTWLAGQINSLPSGG